MGKSKKKRKTVITELETMDQVCIDMSHVEITEIPKEATKPRPTKWKTLEVEENWVKFYHAELGGYKNNFKLVRKNKDLNKSNEYCDKANVMFEKYKAHEEDPSYHIKVLVLYTKSVLYAPRNSECLARAYCNRATVLMTFRRYKECLEDADRALNITTDKLRKMKLICMRVECLHKLEMTTDQKIAYETAMLWIENSGLDVAIQNAQMKKLDEIIARDIKGFISQQQTFIHPKFSETRVSCSPNTLTIECRENFQTKIVANRDIQCGELILAEQSFSTYVSPSEGSQLACSFCGKLAVAAIPCEMCCFALYCSEECKTEASWRYHNAECIFFGYDLDEIVEEESRLVFLTLKVFIELLRGFGGVDNLQTTVEEVQNDAVEDVPISINYNKYGFVPRLLRYMFQLKFSEAKIKANARTSAHLMSLFFGEQFGYSEDDCMETNDDILFISALFTRFLLAIPTIVDTRTKALQCYCYTTVIMKNPYMEYSLHNIYTLCSLLKPSCDGNSGSVQNEGQKVIYAKRFIKEGEEITVDHNYPFYIYERSVREEALLEKHITCQCQACKENWPTLIKLPKMEDFDLPEHIIAGFNDEINACQGIMFGYKKNANEVLSQLMRKIPKEIDILNRLLTKPCREKVEWSICLREVYNTRYGTSSMVKLNCESKIQ